MPPSPEGSPASGDALARWITGVAAVVFAAAIGLPLVGVGVFHGADLLLERAPWRHAPAEVQVASNPLVVDTVTTFTPLHAEVRRRLEDGDFPLWTSYPAGGLPLASVPDGGTLGPLNLPHRILPLWYSPAVAKVLELLAAMGFTFLFLRRLGLGRPAALAGGLIYAMSGFQVVWTNWPQSHVGALIPALFWAVERGIQERSPRSVVPLALILAAMVFEGFPSVTGYAVLGAGIYTVVRVVSERRSVRDRLLPVLLLGGAALAGLGLTALQLLPFADRVGGLDLGYRMQNPDAHLPPSAMFTMAVPNAFGSPTDGSYFGPLNYVEIQSFLGASSLVLVVAAAAWGKPAGLRRGTMGYLWWAAAAAAVLLFVGGPLLGLFQLNSLFELNFVGRLRALFLFLLAALAAIGLEHAAARGPVPATPQARIRQRAVWAVAGLLALGGLARLWIVSERAGQGGSLAQHAVIPLVAGALTAAAVWGSARFRPGRHAVVLWMVPVLFGLEAVAFARSYWPVSERDEFYPVTAAHRQLAHGLGRDRLVGAGGALFPGSTTFYGLRSLTTNNTLPQMPEWEELIRAADPTAFEQSPVFPSLAPGAEVATSPILDRLSVRYFVVPPNLAVFGRREQAAPVQDLFLDPLTINAEASGGPVRAVLLRLVRPWAGPAGRVVATVQHGSGGRVSRGSREIFPGQTEGWFQVPVAEPLCPAGGCGPRLSVSVRAPPGDPRALGPVRAAISVVVGEQDGLRVDIVSNVVGYRNLNALPRIRWAGSAVVEEDGPERIRLLGAGVPENRVLLSGQGPAGSGEEANLEVLEDSGDVIRVRVEAAGDGYLVIADPLQHGWVAELDGASVPLRPADHAVVAIHVPAGAHEVSLSYDPPGWTSGLALSGGSAVGLILLVALGRPRRRPGTPTVTKGRGAVGDAVPGR